VDSQDAVKDGRTQMVFSITSKLRKDIIGMLCKELFLRLI